MNRFIVYDDLRKVGEFARLVDVYNTGLIDKHKTYFYKVFAENEFYHDNNIFVFRINDNAAEIMYLGLEVARLAKNSPNVVGLKKTLIKVLEGITGQSLTSL